MLQGVCACMRVCVRDLENRVYRGYTGDIFTTRAVHSGVPGSKVNMLTENEISLSIV